MPGPREARRCEQMGRVPPRAHTRGHAHSLRWRMQPDPPPGGRSCSPARPRAEPARVPAAPPTDGRWRFNTTPSWARGLFYSLPLLPFSKAKKSIESPRGLHAPSPVCIFLFYPFSPCVSPPPWGLAAPRCGFDCAGLRALDCARPAAGGGRSNVTVSGVWPGPGPRVQSGHFRCRCGLGPGADELRYNPASASPVPLSHPLPSPSPQLPLSLPGPPLPLGPLPLPGHQRPPEQPPPEI